MGRIKPMKPLKDTPGTRLVARMLGTGCRLDRATRRWVAQMGLDMDQWLRESDDLARRKVALSARVPAFMAAADSGAEGEQ